MRIKIDINRSKVVIAIFTLFTIFSSCHKIVDPPIPECEEIMINNHNATVTVSPTLSIISIKVVDHCIVFEVGISGCDADHEIDLITSGSIIKTLPPQLEIGFVDNKPQDCEAYYIKDYSYNLSGINALMGNAESIWINVIGTDISFLYVK